jgi:hypothetical protein
MKRSELNIINNAIIGLINDKIEINGSICGLPLKFEVRKKAHSILKKITDTIEISDKTYKEMYGEILEKYKIPEGTTEIKKDIHPDAYEELINLQKQVNDEDFNIDFSGLEFTDKDFQTSNGRDLDIGANIGPILEYLYK